MDGQIIVSRPGSPPPPPAVQPPAPPTMPDPPAIPLAVGAATGSTARVPLTLANWIKASLLGLGGYVALAFMVGFLDINANYTAIGVVGWIGGALLASYGLGMRYAKAYAAVVGGTFLGVLAVYLVLVYFIGY